MTRQRKEILREMEELDMQEQAEYEMGCGFGTSEIARVFAPFWEKLYGKLAATYGMSVKEYEEAQYEVKKKLCATGIIPFC